MVDEQKKMVDPNRVDDDSDQDSENSEEDGAQANEFTFKSAIDVGSHFIDVNPSSELVFNNFEGTLAATFNLKNPCKACPIAFFVYTSAPIPVFITPNCGFIKEEFSQVVKIVWEASR